MCGIAAVIHGNPASTSAAADLHEALYMLQHRGQDACGIATCARGGRIHQCKGNGMASKVFHDGQRVPELVGHMGIGHLRYPTAGTSSQSEAQPFYVNSPYGICFAHNGNLTNTLELREFLDQEAHRHINTDSDSEILLNIFAHELSATQKRRIDQEDCFNAIQRMYERAEGGFACVAFIAGFGLIAFRDSYGIRPLILGSRTIDGETDYMIASESVALKHLGASPRNMRDIRPGEAVIIEKGKAPVYRRVAQPITYAPDAFEYVYFARPDSIIDGISVSRARREMGKKLAKTIAKQLGPRALKAINVVMAIPETSSTAAKEVAAELGKDLVDGFTKNRYVFRTFIMPDQRLRRTGVRRKLNAHDSEFEGKNVLLIDDSIVRGNTSHEIVQMARDAGALHVTFASCSPPIVNPHIYGIDLAQKSDLIASGKSPQEIASAIGADAVVYQTLPDMSESILENSPRHDIQELEVGVFNGRYITPVSEGYLEHLEELRGERKRQKRQENARQAVVNGMANKDDVEQLVVKDGEHEVGGQVEDAQDIALHNINDHIPTR